MPSLCALLRFNAFFLNGNGHTEPRTDRPLYTDARTHLKIGKRKVRRRRENKRRKKKKNREKVKRRWRAIKPEANTP